MNRNLHKKLVKRLLLAALLLAVLSGIAVFYLEMEKVDEHVASLALEESDNLMSHIAFFTAKNREDFELLQQEVSRHILTEHVITGQFIVVELYNRGKQKVIEVAHPDFPKIEEFMNKHPHSFMLTEDVDSRRFKIDAMFYVQIFTPLKLASGETAGYFEGVYRVDPATMRSINTRLLWSVLQVIAVIFITTAALYPVFILLNRDMIKLSDDLADANMRMLMALGSAVAKRDRDTNSHNFRVTIYAIRLAEAVGLAAGNIKGLIKGSFLHDVGKIGIADAILLKPAGLSKQELKIMETHVQHGVDIIGNYSWLKDSLDVVRFHHEKFDGTGYPSGLKGKDIPIAARIFAIVDVFDALTTKRPYKEPEALETTIRIMREDRGSRFDPELLDVFIGIAPKLYCDVCLTEEKSLQTTLDDLLARHIVHA